MKINKLYKLHLFEVQYLCASIKKITERVLLRNDELQSATIYFPRENKVMILPHLILQSSLYLFITNVVTLVPL